MDYLVHILCAESEITAESAAALAAADTSNLLGKGSLYVPSYHAHTSPPQPTPTHQSLHPGWPLHLGGLLCAQLPAVIGTTHQHLTITCGSTTPGAGAMTEELLQHMHLAK
jgi:hypothetical protein